MIRTALFTVCVTVVAATLPSAASAQDKPRPYRLPSLSDEHFKDPIIWGATAESPDGKYALSFGGHDQIHEDGLGHTRVKVDGEWLEIHEELRQKNPRQGLCDEMRRVRDVTRGFQAKVRHRYFEGEAVLEEDDLKSVRKILNALSNIDKALGTREFTHALERLDPSAGVAVFDRNLMRGDALLSRLDGLVYRLDSAAEPLDAEPPARALSPIVFEPSTGQFVLFGGDHLDYLTNDLWTFDPVKRVWKHHAVELAPPPRGNHTIKATGNGKVLVQGGYTYTSNTDYVGGQYIDIVDPGWEFDLATNRWAGQGDLMTPETRVYRDGPYDPTFYRQDPAPDRAAVTDKLASLPANIWVSMNPPHLPRLNRDWGTAVLDPERDLFLRFSGGHSAHGGSDVLHYHLATNRWELTFPVEFPLGQLYSNTSYPGGFNFNHRPWVTGHTYKGYAVDPVSNQMLFVGHDDHTYYYDPSRGDWTGRKVKPDGMRYNDCFYTLLMCPIYDGARRGIICWTQHGRLFHYDGKADEWTELKLTGDKLPGSVVDRAGIVHDAKRDRLICFRKEYRGPFDGIVYTVDLKTNAVRTLTPGGAAAMVDVGFLREPVYDPQHDIVFIGVNMPIEKGKPRRTPAYDCATNRWVAIELAGDDPNGKDGSNVSLGLVYDAKRGLYWAVDTNSHVYVLKVDLKTAKVKPL